MKLHTAIRSLLVIGATLCVQQVNANELTTVNTIADAGTGASVGVSRPKFNLTDVQREKLRSLKDQYTLDTAQKKAQLKVDKRQLFDLLSKTSVDKDGALALQSKINGLRTDLSNNRLNFMLAANDVFTPEQKEIMRHRMLSRSFGGKHGRYGHGGCGKSGKCGMKHRSFAKGKITTRSAPVSAAKVS